MATTIEIENRMASKDVNLKNLLWATDFSAASLGMLPYVASLARRRESKVFIVHVLTPHPYPLVTPEAWPYSDQLRGAAENYLENLANSEQLSGIEHEPILERGEVAESLNRVIKDRKIDMAIVATHARRGLSHFLLGSVAEQMWRTATCPILTVGPAAALPVGVLVQPKHILYPSDLSNESLAAAPYAQAFATEDAARVTALHIIPETLGASAKLFARAWREEVASFIPSGVEVQCRVEPGCPAEAILRVAREEKAGLIVMGVRSARQMAEEPRSNVAYQVVAEAECPVLTIRAGAARQRQ